MEPTLTPVAPSELPSEKIAFSEKISYGMGNLGTQMVFNPATTFIVFYYTDIVGIAAATVGTILFLSRLLDVLNPFMGVLVDRTNSRFGKARPWLLWMAIPFSIGAVLLFSVPSISPAGKVIYAFITYNLAFTLIYTAVDIPYSSMLPMMSAQSNQRTMFSIIRMILANGGVLLSFAVTLPLVQYFGGGAQGWHRAFLVFGAISLVSLLICFAGTKERVRSSSAHKAAVPLKQGLTALIRNKYWLLIAALGMSLFLILGLLVANLYFCRYFLHRAELFGPLMTMMVIAQIVGMMFCPPIVKKFGKRNTAIIGMIVTIIGQLIIFIDPMSYTVIVVGTVIKGLGAAPLVGTLFAMCADTIEYGEWKFGFRTDGLVFGATALTMKISIGLGNVIVGWILAWGGYVSGADVQSASALVSIKLLFLILPLVIYFIALAILWAYKLDKHYPAIAAELQQRRLANTV